MIKPFLKESMMTYAHKYKLKPNWIQYATDEGACEEMFTEIVKDFTGLDLTVTLARDDDGGNSAYVYLNWEDLEDEDMDKLEKSGIPYEESYELGEWISRKIFPGANSVYLEYLHYDSPNMFISVMIPPEAVTIKP